MSLVRYGEGPSNLPLPVVQPQEEAAGSKWTVISKTAEDCLICYEEPKTLHKMNCCNDAFIHLACLNRHFETGSNECPFCKHVFKDLTNTRVATYTAQELEERSEPVMLDLYATDILTAMGEANTRILVRDNNVDAFATRFLNQARQLRFTPENLTAIAAKILTTIDPSISDNRKNRFLEAIRESARAPIQAHQAPVRIQANLPTALEEFVVQLSADVPIQTCLTDFTGKIRHLNLTATEVKHSLSNTVLDSPFLTDEKKAAFIEALENFQLVQQVPQVPIQQPNIVRHDPPAAVQGPRQPNIAAQAQRRERAPQPRANSFCSPTLILVTLVAIASMASALLIKENNFL